MENNIIDIKFDLDCLPPVMGVIKLMLSDKCPKFDDVILDRRALLMKGKSYAEAFTVLLSGMKDASDPSKFEKIKSEVAEFLRLCEDELNKMVK